MTSSNWLGRNICGVIPLICRGCWSTQTSVGAPFCRASLEHETDSLTRWSFQKLLKHLYANYTHLLQTDCSYNEDCVSSGSLRLAHTYR
ncbi:unnamed protein product [Schistocephalus solidus]|uniref:Uncharacterized protein n=1 Tax=Schistocephalus solidus TaxID=70667 RepID=A0A3P7BRF5_SCHSO|nr:unnamed protein product [Schistocephalus solidus]